MTVASLEWPEDRIERLRALFSGGAVYSEIANALGVSRSAIAGKCKRLGLRRSPAPARPVADKPKREKQALATKVFTAKPVAVRQVQIAAGPGASSASYPFADSANAYPTDARMVTLLDLDPDMCRWPIGEPRDPALRYCGADRAHARPGEDEPIYRFCPFHMKLGTQEGTKLRVRRETSRARAVPTCEREPDLTEVLR